MRWVTQGSRKRVVRGGPFVDCRSTQVHRRGVDRVVHHGRGRGRTDRQLLEVAARGTRDRRRQARGIEVNVIRVTRSNHQRSGRLTIVDRNRPMVSRDDRIAG